MLPAWAEEMSQTNRVSRLRVVLAPGRRGLCALATRPCSHKPDGVLRSSEMTRWVTLDRTGLSCRPSNVRFAPKAT